MDKADISLIIGQQIDRKQLHQKFGGQTQSKISPSKTFPLIFLFSEFHSENEYPKNGFDEEGLFHWIGEGISGDHVFRRGNTAILEHKEKNRELLLFTSLGKNEPLTYIGKFEYVDHFQVDSYEKQHAEIRSSIIFRLRPIGKYFKEHYFSKTNAPSLETKLEEVSLEDKSNEISTLKDASELTEIEGKKIELEQDYYKYCLKRGKKLHHYKINPGNDLDNLYIGFLDKELNTLIEATGSISRDSIRMAVGRILDYRRFFGKNTKTAILVPNKLKNDLKNYLSYNNIGLIEKVEEDFLVS